MVERTGELNREAILEICGVKKVFEIPQTLMTKLFSPEQSDLLDRIAAIYGDRQLDQFRDFFQEEGADRKKLKQDYTPDSVAELLARVSRSGKSLADICAGTGSLTIQYLNYHPDVEFVRCEEFSARVIPFLLINLAIRKIDAEVIHGDSLTREQFAVYKEIFEGDVVEFEDADDIENVYTNRGVVEWCQGGFTVTNRATVSMDDLLDGDKLELEIIGNIYENLELVEVNNDQ